MGLIKAALGAAGGVMADQWKEFFSCEALDTDTLVQKGEKRTSRRSANRYGSENIITNGSGIAVADGQCMIIVEQGKIVELCAEPGLYTYNQSTEPSLFTGKLSESVKDTFKTLGKRFTYGGDTGKDQRIYYFNTKEILGNKFGTPTPISFRVSDPELGILRTVKLRCNGVYTYRMTDPMLFYKRHCGNVASVYTREEIDEELRTEFIDALTPAFAEIARLKVLPAEIPYHAKELKKAMNETLKPEWADERGITIQKIAMNPISMSPEDMKVIQQMEDAYAYGGSARMLAGRMATSTANAMESAAENPNGAMGGFVGLGMGMQAMNQGGMMQQVQSFYNQGQAQAAQAEKKTSQGWRCRCGTENTGKFCENCGQKKPEEEGWTCTCGAVNKGKFCMACGKKKPASAPLYRCDKCGWTPMDPAHPPKFCPECGDVFDDNDVH